MKKLTKIFGLVVIAALTAAMALCFAACQDGNDSGDSEKDYTLFAGTYKFNKYVYDAGVVRTYNIGDVYDGTTLTADYFVVILGDDGTFTVNSPLEENTNVPNGNKIHGDMTGTWEPVNEWTFTVTVGGEDISGLRINDGTLTYQFAGNGLITHTYYLEKV